MDIRSIDDVFIRSATNHDRDRVIELVYSVLREFNLPPDPMGRDADLDDIEGNYIDPGGPFEVIEDKQAQLIGTVGLYRIDHKTCELRKMYFVPQIRGFGLGRQILQRMIAAATRLGFKRIQLETISVLKAAIQLYESAGFIPIEMNHVSSRCDQSYVLNLDNQTRTRFTNPE